MTDAEFIKQLKENMGFNETDKTCESCSFCRVKEENDLYCQLNPAASFPVNASDSCDYHQKGKDQ